MRTDSEIKRDVEAELDWAPDVDATDIAVKVNDGIVALSGFAASYFEKYQAEGAVKRIAGVVAVVNDLTVRPPLAGMPTDPEIARDIVAALQSQLPVAWQNIKPIVKDGHIALEGKLERHDERERAEAAVRRVPGVMSVRNSIALKPRLAPSEIKHKLEEAFRRNAILDAQALTVETRGGEVTLRGEVRSWAERDQARQTAWAAPGVTRVNDEITVRT